MIASNFPAFPIPREIAWATNAGNENTPLVGMTLRDYFAAQAMVFLLNNNDSTWEEDAADAYSIADKMLEAREK